MSPCALDHGCTLCAWHAIGSPHCMQSTAWLEILIDEACFVAAPSTVAPHHCLLFPRLPRAPCSEWAQQGRVREAMTKLNRLSNVTIVDVRPGSHQKFGKKAMALGMRSSTFCLVPHGDTAPTSRHEPASNPAQVTVPRLRVNAAFDWGIVNSDGCVCRLYDAIACGCIPIIISDDFLGAFHEIVPYQRFTLRISEEDFVRDPIKQVVAVTHGADIYRMQDQMRMWSPWILYDCKDSKVVQHIGELLGLAQNRGNAA
eukprot:scaffold7195_cov417-Prasinococcus_capsulatus_cf.AAC.2